jgi:hypothetical protein
VTSSPVAKPQVNPADTVLGTHTSASTTRAPTRRSQVSPCLRPSRPIPPPRVRPAIPTVGPQPAGIVTSCCCRASYTSPSRAPAPTVAVASDTDTACIGVTSSTIPSVEERPAKQWPPLRGAARMPHRRANASVSATSSAL